MKLDRNVRVGQADRRAAEGSWTLDLVLTKDALYQLSSPLADPEVGLTLKTVGTSGE